MALKAGRGSDQFVLRLPDGMRDQIKDAADASGRSMNAEIIHRLTASLAYETMDAWHATRMADQDKDIAERRRDAAALASLVDDLADQISERILADLKGEDRPITRHVGAVKVRKDK